MALSAVGVADHQTEQSEHGSHHQKHHVAGELVGVDPEEYQYSSGGEDGKDFHTSETPAGTGALLWSVAVGDDLIAGAVGIAGVGARGGGPYRAA